MQAKGRNQPEPAGTRATKACETARNSTFPSVFALLPRGRERCWKRREINLTPYYRAARANETLVRIARGLPSPSTAKRRAVHPGPVASTGGLTGCSALKFTFSRLTGRTRTPFTRKPASLRAFSAQTNSEPIRVRACHCSPSNGAPGSGAARDSGSQSCLPSAKLVHACRPKFYDELLPLDRCRPLDCGARSTEISSRDLVWVLRPRHQCWSECLIGCGSILSLVVVK